MIKCKFPYGIQIKHNGRIISLPVLPVRIRSNSKKVSLLLLIDSGAETTLLTREDAELLGINLKKGKETIVGGISSGLLKAFRHEITIEIDQIKLKIPVLFADSNESPRVLGREGIFEHFYVIFEEKAKRTIFIFYNSDSREKIKTILNG